DQPAVEAAKSLLFGREGVIAVADLEPKGGRARIRIDYTGDDAGVVALNQAFAAAGIAIMGFAEETRDLEAMFMRVTKGIVT
ncbi:MAG: hypothetical protein IAE89_01165, partial [Anaerolineae bacterium]|nr:hypothetical protein [Anaerolineae bacterium]